MEVWDQTKDWLCLTEWSMEPVFIVWDNVTAPKAVCESVIYENGADRALVIIYKRNTAIQKDFNILIPINNNKENA